MNEKTQFFVVLPLNKMFVKQLCFSLILCEILLFPLYTVHARQYSNQSSSMHNYWIPDDHEDDFIGYVVNKKKRSAKESRFIKFDYLSQNINVSESVLRSESSTNKIK